MTDVAPALPAAQQFALACRHRTRATLGIGCLFILAAAALCGSGIGFAYLFAAAAGTAARPDPYAFSLSMIALVALNTAIAMGPAVFLLIRSVLRSTVMTSPFRPHDGGVPLAVTATLRDERRRVAAAVLASIPTLGLAWLYFGPLMLARVLESAAPANGVRFRFAGSRWTLAGHAVAAAVILCGASLAVQHLLFGPVQVPPPPWSGDLPAAARPPADPAPVAVLAWLAFVTASTLAATWHFCRLALGGCRAAVPLASPDSAHTVAHARLVPVRYPAPAAPRHAAYLAGWTALGTVTFGLALPFAYTSVLKRVLNHTGAPADP